MDAFTAGLLQRIETTESDLTHARETGDDFLVEVEQAELDDLHRLACRAARAPATSGSRQAAGEGEAVVEVPVDLEDLRAVHQCLA
ncbi:hypothetical protein, partial [Streptomyces sp. NPDC048845]|uniref:hypothetical protein n=1 Tax=Streptomyces sp. NPDC048845 TaxID=3155390 RepID=UPI003443D6E6